MDFLNKYGKKHIEAEIAMHFRRIEEEEKAEFEAWKLKKHLNKSGKKRKLRRKKHKNHK